MNIRFGQDHLDCFSAASLDRNPLHLSASYARKTSSGECVVYGILGFLASLGGIRPPAGRIPSDLRIDFKGPLFVGVDYTAKVEETTPEALRLVLLDGAAAQVRARVRFREGVPTGAVLPEQGTAPLSMARRLDAAELEAAPSFAGRWNPPREACHKLMQLLGIDCDAWGEALPLAAFCTSYLTGMELPGESALYSGLRLRLAAPPRPPLAFEIALRSYNPDLRMAQSQFTLSGGDGVWAEGEISALSRPPRVSLAAEPAEQGAGRFAGKIALIVGASRGLGAAMALKWVAAGGIAVGAYTRSEKDAEDLLAATRELPGRLRMERGDASDRAWCSALKDRIRAEYGRLDLLVCSAAPAIPSLRVEEACLDRIEAYLAKGFSLVAAPLSSFLELVSASGGQVLLISSSAVDDPPALWPHYVAMKSAVEGLVRAAAAGNPDMAFWIARPGRMLTDLSDSPLGRLSAQPPQAVARRILEEIHQPAAPRGVNFCH